MTATKGIGKKWMLCTGNRSSQVDYNMEVMWGPILSGRYIQLTAIHMFFQTIHMNIPLQLEIYQLINKLATISGESAVFNSVLLKLARYLWVLMIFIF